MDFKITKKVNYYSCLDVVKQYELFSGKVSDFRYLDYYQSLAVTRGCLARCDYAVGLMRPEWGKRFKGNYMPGKGL